MIHAPLTPFRRAADAVPAEHRTAVHCPGPVDKWEILRLLSETRRDLGLNDRDLTVLQALLGCHPDRQLSGSGPAPVVFPSNATLCRRLNGMPESTLRRHLARLVASGLIVRRDSPNGKRFVRRGAAGPVVFGFDLSPLHLGADQFRLAAEAARHAAVLEQDLREAISLIRRDLFASLANRPDLAGGGVSDRLNQLGRLLRRRLTAGELKAIHDATEALSREVRSICGATTSTELSADDSQNERHQQRSETEILKMNVRREAEGQVTDQSPACRPTLGRKGVVMPSLDRVLSACPDLPALVGTPIRSWRDLSAAADLLRPMIGIGADLWNEAKELFGIDQASIVLAGLVQRIGSIRSPGAYFRALLAKGANGCFQPVQIIGRQAGSQL